MGHQIGTFGAKFMNLIRSLSALVLTIGVAVSMYAEEPALRITKLPVATLLELAAVQSPSLPKLRTDATITAPPVAVGFPSGWSDANSPADATGAVNETYVMAGSNAGIRVHTRDGSVVSELTLNQFWHWGGNPLTGVHDPRIAYDTAAKRWVATAVRGWEALMVGVSASDDPTGVWFRYEILFENCDRNRLALTRDTIMVAVEAITNNIPETPKGGHRILSFSKAELYAGTATPSIRRSVIEIGTTPVHAPESTIEYIVTVGQSRLRVRRLDQLNEPHHAFDGGFGWERAHEDYAPMAGTRDNVRIGDGGDVQAAIFRDGWLYAVHRIRESTRTADDNALVWWKVDPEGVKASEVGIIDSPADLTYAIPSLAVNRMGGMLISFCTLSEWTYPSAWFVYRDPEGSVSNPAVIRAGDSPVQSSEWGRYTTVVEDPNGRDFWVGQIYATRGTWATWWANVKFAGPPRGRAARH